MSLNKISVIDHCRTKEPTWNENFTFNIRKSQENLLQVSHGSFSGPFWLERSV